MLGICGVNGMFLIQHLVGIEGHPRRMYLSPETCVGYANFANAGLWATIVGILVGIPRSFKLKHIKV